MSLEDVARSSGSSDVADFLRIAHNDDGSLKPSALGGSIASVAPTAVKTTTYAAAVGDLVLADTTSAAFTITLPTAPADKSAVGVKLVTLGVPSGGSTGGLPNNLTVACGGADVLDKTGGATSYVIGRTGQLVIFQYDAAIAAWIVWDGGVPSALLNKVSGTAGYGDAISIGNTSGSFGAGTLATAYAPLVIYQKFGATNLNANVLHTTQALFVQAAYFGPTSDDSAEGASAAVYLKDTGTGFTQANQTTGFEADAQVEGANHATGYVNGIAGRITATLTATIDEAHSVYAGLVGKAAGATITKHMAFFENPNNVGVATNQWTLYGPNDLHVGGFEGNAFYYSDTPQAAALGFKTWNGDPSGFGTGTAPTAGVIYAVAVPYRKGQVVTDTDWYVNVAGSGTNPTHIFTGICDSTGKMLAQSADDAANAGWKVAGGITRSALSGTFTILTSGVYYHVFLQVGAWGTTQATLNRSSGVPQSPAGVLSQATGGTAAQAALPANGSTLVGGLSTSNTPLRFWSGGE